MKPKWGVVVTVVLTMTPLNRPPQRVRVAARPGKAGACDRWKLVSVVLAGCLSYSWWHGDAKSDPSPQAKSSRLKGPLRVSASALGISIDELVRRLFAVKDIEEV